MVFHPREHTATLKTPATLAINQHRSTNKLLSINSRSIHHPNTKADTQRLNPQATKAKLRVST